MEEQKNSLDENLKDILEIVGAIKDGMATKDDLAAVENRLTGKIDAVDIKLTGKIDAVDIKLTRRIDALDNKMTMELRSIQTELDDMKLSLSRLEKRTREDSDASVKDALDFRRRLEALEQQVKKLQAARQMA